MSDEEKEIPKARKPKRKARPSGPATSPAAAAREETGERRSAPPSAASFPIWAVAVAALAVGAAGGWFARGKRGATDATVVPDPATAGSAAAGPTGPCEDWSKELCLRAGDTSEGCAQAKGAAKLLPAAACVAARADVEGTVTKLQAARSSCTTLVERLCNDLGKDSSTCAMVREKTPGFPASRCTEMLSGYDGVLTELKSMEKANAPLSADLATRQGAGSGPGFGPTDAKVTVVEYSDFECPYCSKAAAVVTKLKEKYASKVHFVFRQYPLPMHESAPLAAEAALAAHAQGKFWPFHDQLFQNQRALERESLDKYAAKAGLDTAKFDKALDDHTFAAAVKSDMKLGEEAGVSGTPTLFVGTERVNNPTDFDAVAKQIDAALAK